MTALVERDSVQASVVLSDLRAEIDTLQAMIVQSRQSISRADVLIGLLRTQYSFSEQGPAKVKATD